MNFNQIFCGVFAKQLELNDVAVTGWINKRLDWNTAILVESAEAIDSTNWKWWKTTEDDLENLKVEIIDLLCFVISKSYESCHFDDPSLEFEQIVSKFSITFTQGAAYQKSHEEGNVVHWLKQMTIGALTDNNKLMIQSLGSACSLLGMSAEELKTRHLTKNLLNHYRQERGYNDPSINYRKVVEGKEDNIWFKTIVSGVIIDNPDMDNEALKAVSFSLMDKIVICTESSGSAVNGFNGTRPGQKKARAG
jgi:dimeric dUTPase (all-alpha-NTP-PPase superfamily)